jgi:predicted alpha/beta hydrolase
MTATLDRGRVNDGAPVEPSSRHVRARRTMQIAVVVIGAGMTLIVIDGSWSWAVLRVLVAATCGVALMVVLDRRSPAVSGATGAAVGLVAVAVGGAVLLSYGVAGWSLRQTGGRVVLAGGIVALIVGLAGLTRAIRGWRRLLLVPAVLLVGYAIGFPVAVAVYATNVGRPALGRATPADLGLPYVDAAFTTADGVRLSGWYIPSTNRAAVVLLHGASSTRSAVLDHAVVLARHGYGVLLYDARGMGRSGGRAMGFGWYGDRDVEAALDYLVGRPDVHPGRIAAVGESMGGEEAIGAMAADHRLRAVVAEGATNRVTADWGWLADQYGVRGRVQQGVQWLTYGLADLLSDAPPPISLRDAVATADRPVLLITAGNVADESNAAHYIASAAPSRVQTWNVAGAGHTGGLRTDPAGWEQHVTAFLDRALR